MQQAFQWFSMKWLDQTCSHHTAREDLFCCTKSLNLGRKWRYFHNIKQINAYTEVAAVFLFSVQVEKVFLCNTFWLQHFILEMNCTQDKRWMISWMPPKKTTLLSASYFIHQHKHLYCNLDLHHNGTMPVLESQPSSSKAKIRLLFSQSYSSFVWIWVCVCVCAWRGPLGL